MALSQLLHRISHQEFDLRETRYGLFKIEKFEGKIWRYERGQWHEVTPLPVFGPDDFILDLERSTKPQPAPPASP